MKRIILIKKESRIFFEWEAPFVPDNQPSQGGKGGNKATWIVSIAVTIAIILVTGGLIWYLLKPDSAPKDDVVVNPVKNSHEKKPLRVQENQKKQRIRKVIL